MRHTYPSLCAATLLALAGSASAGEIDVMTQNQYLGTDLTPVITGQQDVVAALENVAASLPSERLAQLARLIRIRSPHVVVLNEAFAYTCEDDEGTPSDQGCGNPRISGAFVDFLAATEANLGGRYVLKSRVGNFAIDDVPFSIDGYDAKLSVKDRDAILVRADIAPVAFGLPLPLLTGCRASFEGEGCNYQAVPTLPTALGPLTIERGYTAVQLAVKGKPYRIFGTHLEVRQILPGPLGEPTRVLQRLQALELAQTATAMAMATPGTETLVVGDINSAREDGFDTLDTPFGALPPPYSVFADVFGFTDVWTRQPAAPRGKGAPLKANTCCQAEDLANPRSALYERIDIIFSLNSEIRVPDAKLLGESIGDKTLPKAFGVWPSDHASVAAKIQY